MKRSLHLILSLFCVAAPTLAQLPIGRMKDVGIDPFDIGTSFYASKGGSATVQPAPVKGRENQRIISDLAEAIEVIRSKHVDGRTVDVSALTKSAIGGALQSLDPHSSYFDASEYGQFLSEEQSEYSGIGASIAGFWRGGQFDTYVTSTVPGSPAASARLAFGDRIISVNGTNVYGKGTDEVRDAVRGDAGSKMSLTVERAANGNIETLNIHRRMMQQPSIRDSFLLPGGIGYIAMTEGFNYTTADELSASLRELHKQGAKGLILDIRENPGGILEQAVRVAEKFLPAGSLILTQRGRSRLDNRVWTSANHSPETMPLVLLVNEDSASASEILAGALQDHDRALIVGERTFGKGLVQSLFDGPAGTGLTLTTARYYTPSGRSIQRDYSDGSLYDYYNHHDTVAADKQIAAKTSANRTVFGGDGIEPDVLIRSHQMDKSERSIDDLIFFFTRELINGRLSSGFSLKANFVKGAVPDTSASAVDAQLLNEFEKFAKTASGDGLASVDLQSRQSFITERINYFLTLARRGDLPANRLSMITDLAVLKALTELPKARELALASLSRH
jgi:carboxyl-terminal processing protease